MSCEAAKSAESAVKPSVEGFANGSNVLSKEQEGIRLRKASLEKVTIDEWER